MTLYFSWVTPGETYDSAVHARCDLPIFKLEITQQEGAVALAVLVTSADAFPLKTQHYAFIAYKLPEGRGERIFSGKISGIPTNLGESLLLLHFSAEPDNAHQQLAQLYTSLKNSPHWDKLFVDPQDYDNPSEALEAWPALYTWDRITGVVTVSDLFLGAHTLELSDDIFLGSLKIRLTEPPLASVAVTLCAEWVQEAQGEVYIAPRIAACFPQGWINTLTPNYLRHSWPAEDKRLPKSNYWVVNSSLTAVIPPHTGGLNLYPTVSQPFWTYDETHHKPRLVRVRRSWFKARLCLAWSYRQKRCEKVIFTVRNGYVPYHSQARKRHLRIQLQPIDEKSSGGLIPPTSASFFTTQRGHQAVGHAIDRACTHLASTARTVEIDFKCSFEKAWTISLDHTVKLVLKRPTSTLHIVGKVIDYRLTITAQKAEAWIKIACIGGEEQDKILPEEKLPPAYVVEDYASLNPSLDHQTACGMSYKDFSHHQPTQGLVKGIELSSYDIVKAVGISGGPEEQLLHLHENQYPKRYHLNTVLQEVPTRISLSLLDLNTTDVAEHIIPVTVSQPWLPPSQIKEIPHAI